MCIYIYIYIFIYLFICLCEVACHALRFILWHTSFFTISLWCLHVRNPKRIPIQPSLRRWLIGRACTPDGYACLGKGTTCDSSLAPRVARLDGVSCSCRLCIGSGAGFLRLAEPKLDLGSWTTFLWIPSTLVRPSSPTFRSWNSKVWSHNHECFSIADFCWREP